MTKPATKLSDQFRRRPASRRATGTKSAIKRRPALPDDVIYKLMEHMDANTFATSRLVSKLWNAISLSGSLVEHQLNTLAPRWRILRPAKNKDPLKELAWHRRLEANICRGPPKISRRPITEPQATATHRYNSSDWYYEELNTLWDPFYCQESIRNVFDPDSDFDKSSFCQTFSHDCWAAAYHPGTNRVIITEVNRRGNFLLSSNKNEMGPHHHIDLDEGCSVSRIQFSNDDKWLALDVSGSLQLWHFEGEFKLNRIIASKQILGSRFSLHSKMLALSQIQKDNQLTSSVINLENGSLKFSTTHGLNTAGSGSPIAIHSAFPADDARVFFTGISGNEVLVGRLSDPKTSPFIKHKIGTDRITELSTWTYPNMLILGTERGRIATYSLFEDNLTCLWSCDLPRGPIRSFFWSRETEKSYAEVGDEIYALSFPEPQKVLPSSSRKAATRAAKKLLKPRRPTDREG